MIKIALCDDELSAIGSLRDKISELLRLKSIEHHISFFLNGSSLLAQQEYFDIVFLDIRMNGLDGIETARRLFRREPNCSLVFVTALKEYVFDAFEVNAANYLLKPVDDGKLAATLDKLVSRAEKRDSRFLTLCMGQEFDKIKLTDILYCEAADHKVFVYTDSGANDSGRKIEELESELDEDFFRCHRSYILNFRHVQRYRDGFAVLTSGEKLPVAKRRQPEFMKALLLFQRREVR